MNKKIAIIIYGQLRQFDIAVKSWKFKDELDCDFYFSTWSKTKVASENYDTIIDEIITEESINKFIPEAKISIEDDPDVHNITCKTMKVIYHMKNGLNMIKDSGKKYDMLILTRSDIYTTLHDDYKIFENLCEENKIYGLGDLNYDTQFLTVDFYVMGNYITLEKLIVSLDDGMVNMHEGFAKKIIENGLSYEIISGLHGTMVRPNVRELKEEEYNHFSISKKCFEWGANF